MNHRIEVLIDIPQLKQWNQSFVHIASDIVYSGSGQWLIEMIKSPVQHFDINQPIDCVDLFGKWYAAFTDRFGNDPDGLTIYWRQYPILIIDPNEGDSFVRNQNAVAIYARCAVNKARPVDF